MTEQQQLEAQLDRLRQRIATSHPRSYSAKEARDLITSLERPTCPLSTAEKLKAVTETLRDYQRNTQFTDPILHHHGDRGPDE